MPSEGIHRKYRSEILSWEESERIVKIFVSLGVTKLRITGGEPFIRKGIMEFIKNICQVKGLDQVHITTNGVGIASLIPDLKKIGISGINLSLDTLSKNRFLQITRHDHFDSVMDTFHAILHNCIPLKINTVVKDCLNIVDILPLTRLTRLYPVEVRFIEEMPFNGNNSIYKNGWNARRILKYLKKHLPLIEGIERSNSTSWTFSIPGHKGTVGIIAGYSRLFCNSCCRIRVTAKGVLKTCLYDSGVLDLKSMLRHGYPDVKIQRAIRSHVKNREEDGFQVFLKRKNLMSMGSMALIGG
jgi:cyclic pyranopterin phosphate synthase